MAKLGLQYDIWQPWIEKRIHDDFLSFFDFPLRSDSDNIDTLGQGCKAEISCKPKKLFGKSKGRSGHVFTYRAIVSSRYLKAPIQSNIVCHN